MKFNPKDAVRCLNAGTYDASILTAAETFSKANKPMLAVTYEVYTDTGGKVTVYDYIVIPAALWKLKKICAALGDKFAKRFESGDLPPEMLIGANLRLELEVEEDAIYGDKNHVKAYHPSTLAVSAAPARKLPPGMTDEPMTEDQIPFDAAPIRP